MPAKPQTKRETLTEVLRSPYEFELLRGPARLAGDYIVLDVRRCEKYLPHRVPGIGLNLMGVRSPRDAVEFATRFGLFWNDKAHVFGHQWSSTLLLKLKKRHFTARERVSDFIKAGSSLRDVVSTVQTVRRVVRWREQTGGLDKQLTPEEMNLTNDQLREMMDGATKKLTDGLMSEDRPTFYDRSVVGDVGATVGEIRLGIVTANLKAICFLQVGYMLMNNEPIAECKRCRVAFRPGDKRQVFCTLQCGTSSRVEKWRNENPTKGRKATK